MYCYSSKVSQKACCTVSGPKKTLGYRFFFAHFCLYKTRNLIPGKGLTLKQLFINLLQARCRKRQKFAFQSTKISHLDNWIVIYLFHFSVVKIAIPISHTSNQIARRGFALGHKIANKYYLARIFSKNSLKLLISLRIKKTVDQPTRENKTLALRPLYRAVRSIYWDTKIDWKRKCKIWAI